MQNLLAVGQFHHLASGQQDVGEFFHALNQGTEENVLTRKWPDIAQLFQFSSFVRVTCANQGCQASRDEDEVSKISVLCSLPQREASDVSSQAMKRIIEETFFKVYNADRIGCQVHQDAGAFEEEVLIQLPDFLLVLLKRHEIRRVPADDSDDEDEFIHIGRSDRVNNPEIVSLSSADAVLSTNYRLCGLIGWDGYVCPNTGATRGHYIADINFGDNWFRANDNEVKAISKRKVTKNAVALMYTKFAV